MQPAETVASTTLAAPAKRKFLLAGKWTDSAEIMRIFSPWTGQVVAEVHAATAQQARQAGEAARLAAPALRALTCAKRSDALRFVSQKIAQRADEIAAVIRDQVGKPMWLSRGEVQRAVNVFRLASEEALRLPGEVLYPDREPQGAGMVGRVQYFPLGPVLGITPFNFPLNLVAHKVAPALAAGCPIVIKPPPQGPGAALILGEIVLESGLPESSLQVLPGGLEAGQALCASDAFAAVSFTGSAKAGWSIKRSALPRQKVLLEMGGNAAVIVDDSADLDLAAKAVATAGYAYAGQVCISTQRVFAHKAVYERFRSKLVETIRTQVSISENPADENTAVGPLISKDAADRIDGWVQSALQHGAIAPVRGERRGERLMTPWLLENVATSEPVSCEEVFGPVVLLQQVSSIHEGIAQANASKYGLQTSVFTQSLQNAEVAFREIEAGAVLVNVPTSFRIDAALYGGTKESGFGREGVAEVVRTFSEPRVLVVRP
ncbi:MAG TPA: aldehyde dehydrogenase family protein [Planctomycetota bacterium]